ncbi:hypothetical protein SLEP1_g42980 [Rubroshorea leprosula]|uniref:Uncharacterized protein n=1 Tax=Rubroshorea leprosula TaxID=152421 RepID=A0AAV5LD11_9ROSI|nr:hypothetical protein SLEP1_g42980 [Rubroshorea leprosula]
MWVKSNRTGHALYATRTYLMLAVLMKGACFAGPRPQVMCKASDLLRSLISQAYTRALLESRPVTSGIRARFDSLVTWKRIVTMANQGAEASKVVEVPEERGRRETRGDTQRTRRSKALSPASRDAFTAYESRLVKLELAMDDVHEQLDTLDSRMEEQEDRGGCQNRDFK